MDVTDLFWKMLVLELDSVVQWGHARSFHSLSPSWPFICFSKTVTCPVGSQF